jgi:hypothetical protein
MEQEVSHGETQFTREFKLEAVRLIKERGFLAGHRRSAAPATCRGKGSPVSRQGVLAMVGWTLPLFCKRYTPSVCRTVKFFSANCGFRLMLILIPSKSEGPHAGGNCYGR